MPAHTPADDGALLSSFSQYELAVLGFSQSTIENHRTYLNNFICWWQHTHPASSSVTTAKAADVAAFLVAETQRGMAIATRKSELGAIRAFYDWLVLNETVSVNPGALVPGPRAGPPANEVYTAAQAEAILAHTASLTDLGGRQRHAIVATLRYTGMRSGELRTLHREHVDLESGRAEVIGKHKRRRTVLLPPALIPVMECFLAEVRPQLPESPLLLANPHRLVTTPLHGFGNEPLHREVRLAGRGAGVPGRHFPHKWRHTYATELVRAGIDIHVVQRLMGHTHIASTVGYTHLAVDDLRDAVRHLWGPAA